MLMAARVTKDERIFSLILALVASRDGLTKQQILSTVHGYATDFASGKNREALERKFERDKGEVRDMGVNIEMIEPTGEAGTTHNQRYFISHSDYDLPESMTLTPKEMTLLGLAGRAWQERSLMEDARNGLTKLTALGVDADDSLVGVSPQMATGGRILGIVSSAIDSKRALHFQYIKPGDNAAKSRMAAPLGLLFWKGHWYMLAFDLLAGGERTFLLDRIASDPKVDEEIVHERDNEDFAARLQVELEQLEKLNEATIELTPGSDARLRLAVKYGFLADTATIYVPYADEALLADELAGFGPEVRVLAPPSLIDAVKQRLTTVIETHKAVK
jgi:proteasome accessory factor B